MRSLKDTRGLTLIELVVAMAIFALVAVMGLQSLTGTLSIRDRLVEIDSDQAALSQAVAMLRSDLSAVLPMLFFPPDRQAPQSALRLAAGGRELQLSVGGQPDGTNTDARQRVIWRLDSASGELSRQQWRSLTPANTSARQPEVLFLTGVQRLEVRSYWAGLGWVSGVRLPGGVAPAQGAGDEDAGGVAPEVYSDLLPRAIEITLYLEGGKDIRLVEALP